MDGSEDPKTLLASEEVLHRIDWICRRRFPDENDAVECHNYVFDKLLEDDCRRLRLYKGRGGCSFTTYVYTVINSLVVDFVREREGRRRIPEIVSRLGQLAVAVYELICHKRYSLSDAFEMLCMRDLYKAGYDAFLAEVEIVSAAPCPEKRVFMTMDDPDSPGPEISDVEDNPLEQLLARLDQERRIKASRVIREVTSELSEEDQMLVRLKFASDCRTGEVAKALGLEAAMIRKKLKSLLTRYRARLLSEGIREP